MSQTNHRSGFGLIEVVIAMGIGMLVLFGITTLLTQTMKQNAQIQTKLDLVETEKSLLEAFKNADNCTPQLAKDASDKERTIDLSGTADAESGLLPKASVDLNSIKLGPDAPKPLAEVGKFLNDGSTRVEVSSVKLVDVSPINSASGHYSGFIEIGFKQFEGSIAYKPIRVPQQFVVNTADDIAARRITACQADGARAPSSAGGPGDLKYFSRPIGLMGTGGLAKTARTAVQPDGSTVAIGEGDFVYTMPMENKPDDCYLSVWQRPKDLVCDWTFVHDPNLHTATLKWGNDTYKIKSADTSVTMEVPYSKEVPDTAKEVLVSFRGERGHGSVEIKVPESSTIMSRDAGTKPLYLTLGERPYTSAYVEGTGIVDTTGDWETTEHWIPYDTTRRFEVNIAGQKMYDNYLTQVFRGLSFPAGRVVIRGYR